MYTHLPICTHFPRLAWVVWIGTKVKPDFPKLTLKWPPPICSQLYIWFGGSLLSSSSSSTHQPRLRVSIMHITAYATYAMISLLPLCGNSHTACMPASPHRHVRPGAIRLELFAIECRSIDWASIRLPPLRPESTAFHLQHVISFTG